MTFGVNNVINCINQSAIRTDLTALELLQLTGSDCQFDKCAVFSAACQASLPTASCNTGRFVYITSECKYYFSNGSIWTDDVDSQLVSSMYSWGWGCNGSLGDNTTVTKSSPVSVVGGFTDWRQVSVGGLGGAGSNNAFGLAVRTNGTAWAWGNGSGGKLGNGTTTNHSSPVSVIGGFTDWCQVSTSRFNNGFSLAVKQNGTAWAWGCNNYGQIGDNTTVSKSSPVSVVGGFTDWCQISAGGRHSLAVRQNGTAWAWGRGGYGPLGDGTAVNKSSPVSVVGGFTNWCQVSGGYNFSLGLRTNGTLWAWGYGNQGQLGIGCLVFYPLSPLSVVGGFTDWCQVSAGSTHSLGVRQNGTAWAWGNNASGRLGDNTTVNKSSPVSVVGGFTNWCQVAAGGLHSLGLKQDSTPWAWGDGTDGRLGNNCTTNRSSPVSVVGGFTDWCQVSAGYSTSAGIRKTKGF